MRQFDIDRIRDDFPILDRELYGRPLVYLDNAATAQKPRQVIEAMETMMLNSNGNIHRGAHRLSDEATALYESARETVREFIGAESPDEIIFTSGATASLNLAARSLCELLVAEGDNVIVSEMEHHSNIVPWQLACRGEIRTLPFDDSGELQLDTLESLIDERTKILAITQCSNVLGTRTDIARAAAIAHRHGVTVVVDGCQGVVHGGGSDSKTSDSKTWVNVSELDCDLYAFSGHKLYGPTGIGVLYGRRELLERMPPLFGGGDMVDRVSFAGSTWAALPFKFEAGTSNFVGAVGLAEAIKYLTQFDPRDIERHEQALLRLATEGLEKIEGLRIYGTAPDKAPIVSFTVEGTHASDIGVLLDKQGIATRTGTHCAQPLADHYGVSSICRASFALYNTPYEVTKLIESLQKALKMLTR
ncbi:MAG: SufS family cysteine desulfurase [Alistipes sp.]|jgi:cysteine desulfurase/selenocysteine lyase|nr:SufS family cysteine desulfurase [Alistipes sp.]